MKNIPCYLFCLLCLLNCHPLVAQQAKTYEEALATVESAWEYKANATDSLLNELRESIAAFKRTVEVPDSVWARAYVQLGFTAGELRDYGTAESAINLAEPFLERAEMSQRGRFFCYSAAAGALTRLTVFETATPFAKRAVELAPSSSDKIDALSRYAYCYLGQNDLETAIGILDQAVAMEGKASAAHVAKIMSNYGVLLVGIGDCSGAMDKFAGAIRLSTDPKKKVRPHLMRARCLTKDAKRDSARREIEIAMRIMAPESQADLPISAIRYDNGFNQKDRELILTLASERTRLLFELDELEEAEISFSQQYDLLRTMRETLVSDYSRRVSNGVNRWAFDRMVTYSLKKFSAGNPEELLWGALAASDQARAYTLQLNRANEELARSAIENALLEDIARLEREDGVPAELSTARLELNRLRSVEPRQHLKRITANELQKEVTGYLRQQEAEAIVYHVSDTVAWAIHLPTEGRPTAWRIPGTDSLRRQIEAWRTTLRESAYKQKSLRNTGEQDSLDRAFFAQGKALAGILLPEGLSDKRLILLPDGPLHFLPFAALPLGEADFPLDYGQLTYLSTDRDLQAAFSLRLLTAPPLTSPPTDNNLIAFAPEFKGEATPGMVSRSVGNARNLPALQPLAAAKAEVETIAGLVPGSEKVIGAAADRQRFLAAAPSARVLHLSAHGMVDAEKPERSFVAFSQPGDSINTEELLYLNDLYTLSMNAELTVLSACETSLGKLSPGDLPLTMGGAFAAAGARSTLTTLWQVDDAATKEVMVDFYRNLMDGRSRAEALQRAQGARRETDVHQHPYFWAGVTLQGEAGPLDLDPGQSWWWWVVGLLVVGAGVVLVRRK